MYQQGTKFYMPIRLIGISLDDVSSIEFTFKQMKDMNADSLKTALWDSDNETEEAFVTQDSSGKEVIAIAWTMEETYLFKTDKFFYIHARIHMKNTEMNPPVKIVPIIMNATLFALGEVVTE